MSTLRKYAPELDGPLYSHLDFKLQEELKALVKKYSEIFHLPGSPLGIVKGFYRNIDTGTSPPMDKLPYQKSFSEMCAIKQELERMLKLNIIQPSASAWGAPCILVRKPLEKGSPSPLILWWIIGPLTKLPKEMATPSHQFPTFWTL